MVFNGTHRIVGAGNDDAANAETYMGVVRNRYLDPAPVRVMVDSFDPSSGEFNVSVEMYSESSSLDSDTILFALIEDDVAFDNTRITRQILTDSISLSGAGNIETFDGSFDIDSSWDPANLHLVAFIQRPDGEILQTGSDYETPDTMVRAIAASERVLFAASDSSAEFPPVTVINVGRAETFLIETVIDEAPSEGWSVSFRDGDGLVHTDAATFSLAEGEQLDCSAIVDPASKGSLAFHFEISSPDLEKDLEIPMGFVSNDVDVLVIDDDGGFDYEKYFTAALASLGKSYGVWDRSGTELPPAAASAGVLLWNVGLGYPSLDAADRAFLEAYLDAGGALFLSGQDIGWDLNSSQSGNSAPSFYHEYLHAFWFADDAGVVDLEGVPGDPLSDSLNLHIAGGDGADNQDYPDAIMPFGADVSVIFNYLGNARAGAVRFEDSNSGARVVYLAFGFEGIDNAEDRATLMRRALSWLHPLSSVDDFTDTRLDSGWDIAPM